MTIDVINVPWMMERTASPRVFSKHTGIRLKRRVARDGVGMGRGTLNIVAQKNSFASKSRITAVDTYFNG